jgi:hypothetical protein
MAVWNVINHTDVGGGGAANYEQTGFSTSYDHLYVVANVRIDDSVASSANRTTYVQLGTSGSIDTGSNYTYRGGQITDSSASTTSVSSGATHFYTARAALDGDTAGVFSTLEIWIPNYANTSNYKQMTWKGWRPNFSNTNDHFFTGFGCGSWANTGAVNSIKLTPSSGTFEEHSTFTVYALDATPS